MLCIPLFIFWISAVTFSGFYVLTKPLILETRFSIGFKNGM